MRLTLAALFLLVLSVPGAAQLCPLKESPEVRGFKLGQAYEGIKNETPEKAIAKDEVNEFGLRRVLILSPTMIARIYRNTPEAWAKRFEGVEGIRLSFLDDKLAAFEMIYDNSTKWYNPLEFTASVAKNLNLPTKGWRGSLPTFLDCEGFTVETMIGHIGNPELAIKVRGFDGELVTRKYENERKKREKFKP